MLSETELKIALNCAVMAMKKIDEDAPVLANYGANAGSIRRGVEKLRLKLEDLVEQAVQQREAAVSKMAADIEAKKKAGQPAPPAPAVEVELLDEKEPATEPAVA